MTKKVDERISSVKRKTNETEILVKVNLDGCGYNNIKTDLRTFLWKWDDNFTIIKKTLSNTCI